MQTPQDAITALRQKFPDGMPDVHSLSDEQKAWLHMKIQSIAEEIVPSQVISQLEKIGNRLIHATEDLPDDEMQRIVSFVFANMDEIETMSKKG
ncbi:hypothetical protein [uncultured Fibrobacter sp.]|uniref:hypothetical protein n=1 Tax=uncultured Fibrobacter sp. TaxID=261512 RepID=UPI00260F7313|nr:hypothetical protein [uncultured Fibrobacter sp.]